MACLILLDDLDFSVVYIFIGIIIERDANYTVLFISGNFKPAMETLQQNFLITAYLISTLKLLTTIDFATCK